MPRWLYDLGDHQKRIQPPALPVRESSLVEIEYELRRDERNVGLDKIDITVQMASQCLKARRLLGRSNHSPTVVKCRDRKVVIRPSQSNAIFCAFLFAGDCFSQEQASLKSPLRLEPILGSAIPFFVTSSICSDSTLHFLLTVFL
jgi:hypothetical protein